jgi:hypothetical protein
LCTRSSAVKKNQLESQKYVLWIRDCSWRHLLAEQGLKFLIWLHNTLFSKIRQFSEISILPGSSPQKIQTCLKKGLLDPLTLRKLIQVQDNVTNHNCNKPCTRPSVSGWSRNAVLPLPFFGARRRGVGERVGMCFLGFPILVKLTRPQQLHRLPSNPAGPNRGSLDCAVTLYPLGQANPHE